MECPAPSAPWWRPALNPEEIPAAALPDAGPNADDPMLDAWQTRLGGTDALRTRLQYDGIDATALEQALAGNPEIPEPEWAAFCLSALDHFDSGWPDSHLEIPLGHLLLPFARQGLDRLLANARGPWAKWKPQNDGETLLRFLAGRLVPVASVVLCPAFSEFRKSFPTNEQDAKDAAFTVWIARLRDGGLRAILARFPMLARILATLTMDAADGLAEMLRRLDADASMIGALFGLNAPPGRMSALRPGLSDRHNHGRQVCALEWPDGRRVFYKPKSGDVDAAWHNWIRDLREREGLRDFLAPPLSVLARDGYTWAVAATHGQPADRDDYARMAGGLAALAFALEARDLIMDNLVATRDGPVVIDAEAMLQPLCAPANFPRSAIIPELVGKLRDAHRFDLPDTGLLGAWQNSASGPVDIGGLTGRGKYNSQLLQSEIVDPNLDTMRVERRAAPVAAEANLPPDADGAPSNWLPPGPMREGFRRVAARLHDLAPMLAADGPGSLADRFGQCTGRFLLRPTGTYARVLLSMTDGMALRHAVLHRLGAESLLKPFLSGSSPAPAAWPFLSCEARALVRRDIPFFPFQLDDGTSAHFACSALAMAQARVRALDPASLKRQERLLRCALVLQPAAPRDPDPKLAAARTAGEFLLQSPDDEEEDWLEGGEGDTPSFPALAVYHGRSGSAFFLAALAHATGDTRYSSRARRELERIAAALPQWIETAPPGASDGLGGLLHATLRASRWLADPESEATFTAYALQFAHRLTTLDQAGDIAGGMAGGVFALLGLANDFPAISAIAENLANATLPVLRAEAARIDGSHGETGFAHGWCGLAAALLRSGTWAQSADAHTDALRLLAHAARLAEATGWDHLPVHAHAPAATPPMHAWCHGLPGFLCAAAECLDAGIQDPRPKNWLHHAATRLAAVAPHACEDSCCGNASRLEALREAAALGVAPAARVLADAAADLLRRRLPPGLFRVATTAQDALLLSPGFFKGQAGPAYLFLRLANPKAYPSLPRWK